MLIAGQRPARLLNRSETETPSSPPPVGTVMGFCNLSGRRCNSTACTARAVASGNRCPTGVPAIGRRPAAYVGKTGVTDKSDCNSDATEMQSVGPKIAPHESPSNRRIPLSNNALQRSSKNRRTTKSGLPEYQPAWPIRHRWWKHCARLPHCPIWSPNRRGFWGSNREAHAGPWFPSSSLMGTSAP